MRTVHLGHGGGQLERRRGAVVDGGGGRPLAGLSAPSSSTEVRLLSEPEKYVTPATAPPSSTATLSTRPATMTRGALRRPGEHRLFASRVRVPGGAVRADLAAGTADEVAHPVVLVRGPGRQRAGPPGLGEDRPAVTVRIGSGAGPVGGGWNGAPETDAGRPWWLSLMAWWLPVWWPLIGPAVKPKEARPGPAGGAGPYAGSAGSAAVLSAADEEPALFEPKALQLWESAMSSSSASSRNEFTAGGRR